MKKVFALLLIPFFAACIRVDNAEPGSDYRSEQEKPTDGVFIHISKGADEVHTVLMALMLADKFSTTNDVLVFFDKDGIELLTEDAPNLEMEHFDSSDDVFKRLVNEGAHILACPACMKIAGVEEGDLRAGVKLAEKEMFLNFTEGRILTLDY
jgi:predicted peroxiredoxin